MSLYQRVQSVLGTARSRASARARVTTDRLGFTFHEKMEGTVVRTGPAGDAGERSFVFAFDVRAPSVLGFATTAVGEMVGSVCIDGLASDAPARGRIEISPLYRSTIRYAFDFTGDDGRSYRFDGAKTTTARRHLVGWTTLPGKVFDADGAVWGEAVLHFSLRRDLRALLQSFRVGSR